MIHTFHASGLFFCEMSLLCTSDTTQRGFFFFPWPSLPVLLGGAPSAWRCKSLHTFAPLKVTAAADLWREGGTFPDPSDPEDLEELLNDICRFSLWNGDGVHSSGRSPACGSFSAGFRAVEALGVTVDMALRPPPPAVAAGVQSATQPPL